MSTRERILMIRLMEKLEKQPAYAKLLGVEVVGAAKDQNMEYEPQGLPACEAHRAIFGG